MFLEAFPGQGSKVYKSDQPEIDLLSDTLKNHYEIEKIVRPSIYFGNSYGLYAALVAAGVLSSELAYKIARDRAKLVNEAEDKSDKKTSMMALIGLNEDLINYSISKINNSDGIYRLFITNFNGPGAYVISGWNNYLEKFKEILRESGQRFKSIDLPVKGAYHHPIREAESDEYRKILEEVEFSPPQGLLISSTKPRILKTISDIKEELVLQMIRPVELQKAISLMIEQRVQIVIDSGPGNMIQRLIKAITDKINVISFEKDGTNLKNLLI